MPDLDLYRVTLVGSGVLWLLLLLGVLWGAAVHFRGWYDGSRPEGHLEGLALLTLAPVIALPALRIVGIGVSLTSLAAAGLFGIVVKRLCDRKVRALAAEREGAAGHVEDGSRALTPGRPRDVGLEAPDG